MPTPARLPPSTGRSRSRASEGSGTARRMTTHRPPGSQQRGSLCRRRPCHLGLHGEETASGLRCLLGRSSPGRTPADHRRLPPRVPTKHHTGQKRILSKTRLLLTPRRPSSKEARLPVLLPQTSRYPGPSQNLIETPARDRPTSGQVLAACVWACGLGGVPLPAPLLGGHAGADGRGAYRWTAGHVVTLLKAPIVKSRVRGHPHHAPTTTPNSELRPTGSAEHRTVPNSKRTASSALRTSDDTNLKREALRKANALAQRR